MVEILVLHNNSFSCFFQSPKEELCQWQCIGRPEVRTESFLMEREETPEWKKKKLPHSGALELLSGWNSSISAVKVTSLSLKDMYLILGLERVHCLGLPAKGGVLGKVRSLHPESDGFTGETKNMVAWRPQLLRAKAWSYGSDKQQSLAYKNRHYEGNGGKCGQFSPDWLDVVSDPANQGTAGPHSLWPSSTFHTVSLPPRWRKTRI